MRKQMETDVLILGNNLSGLLTAYLLAEQNIASVIVDRHRHREIQRNRIHFEDDTKIKELLSLSQEDDPSSFMETVMEITYKLDDIILRLGEPCGYERKPSCNFKVNSGIHIYDEMLSYSTGIQVNIVSLKRALRHFCKEKEIGIYDKTDIQELDLENKLLKSAQFEIRYEKLVVADSKESELFFDKRYFSFNNLNALLTTGGANIVSDSMNLVTGLQQALFINPGVQFQPLPYIGSHEEYRDVYFNVDSGMNDLLYGLVGATYLVNGFREANNKEQAEDCYIM